MNDIILVILAFKISLVITLALILDMIFKEVNRFHPLVGFGRLANYLEGKLNNQNHSKFINISLGLFSWALMVLPIPMVLYFQLANTSIIISILVNCTGLYFVLGLASLKQHGLQVYEPLSNNDLATARKFTGYLVSRETKQLTANQMARATTESMLENGHDAVIASLVCYVIGGLPLAILHRLANTLDAMWGYKNKRYKNFGLISARMDDLLGFISAKICSFIYAIQGIFSKRFIQALNNAYHQGNQYKSHNGGWVMAAGATVLNIKLGGAAVYDGKEHHGVNLGPTHLNADTQLNAQHILKSLKLIKRSAWIFAFVIFLLELYQWL